MEVGIFDILILFSSLAISLAVVVPLAGVLVRFRANYNPKSLQLDPEDGPQPHTGPIINSYFGMFKRVYQLEVGDNQVYELCAGGTNAIYLRD